MKLVPPTAAALSIDTHRGSACAVNAVLEGYFLVGFPGIPRVSNRTVPGRQKRDSVDVF